MIETCDIAKVTHCRNIKKQHKVLKQIETLASGHRPVKQLTRQSKLFKSILKGIFAKKGEEVLSLDLRKIAESSTDFFIICQASNANQVKAIADSIHEQVKNETGEFPYRQEGFQHAKWVLIDYINVVVHIMQPEPRAFYQLEELWSDAPSQQHEPT